MVVCVKLCAVDFSDKYQFFMTQESIYDRVTLPQRNIIATVLILDVSCYIVHRAYLFAMYRLDIVINLVSSIKAIYRHVRSG